MSFEFGSLTGNFAVGFYLTNWGYPIKHDWEMGLYLFKWYVGIKKKDKELS